MYFFISDKYWRLSSKDKLDGPIPINEFWGKIIDDNDGNDNSKTGIDAIYSDFFDKKTYLFKGDLVYSYDKKREGRGWIS